MQKQQNEYGIYIVEQSGNGPFNRAMLMNVGAAEALKQHDYQEYNVKKTAANLKLWLLLPSHKQYIWVKLMMGHNVNKQKIFKSSLG